MSLVWHGKEVADKAIRAMALAGNSILGDAVVEAKQLVPVRTTHLQGSIQMRPMEMTSKTGLRGMFGSFAMHYAIYVEKGTRPHVILTKTRTVNHPGTKPHPYLKPAADKFFPQLAQRAREMFQNG